MFLIQANFLACLHCFAVTWLFWHYGRYGGKEGGWRGRVIEAEKLSRENVLDANLVSFSTLISFLS